MQDISLDLIKYILVKAETLEETHFNLLHSDETIQNVLFMIDADLIDADVFYSNEGFYCAVVAGLTPHGLTLLNLIRDDETYRKVCDLVGSSFTIDLVMKTAEMLRLKQIEERINNDDTYQA